LRIFKYPYAVLSTEVTMVISTQVVPIAINTHVRYRGYDFEVLACCGHHILRVKQIYQDIAACVAADQTTTYVIPDRLIWIPIQDLEPLTLAELRQVLPLSAPAKSVSPQQSQPQSTPKGVEIASTPATAKVQTQMPVAIMSHSLAPKLTNQMSIQVSGSQPVDSQRRVLINQSDQLQRKLWRFALKSQGVTVLMADLQQPLMEQIETHQPHLLIQEMNTTQFNPYEFCRECRILKPKLAIILTQYSDRAIVEGEKRWATSQGAADIIADLRPTVEALIPSVVYVLGRLGLPSPDMDALRQSLNPARRTLGSPVTSGSQLLLPAVSDQPETEPRSRNLLTGLFQMLGFPPQQAETSTLEQNQSKDEESSPQESQSFWHRKLW
ncbi:MAG: hypothetical protein ACFCU9_01325, partial [Cyanophyceae cyanobacterium]